MTPMIDIVFQMIIFFVCTVQLEKDMINEQIRLAMAPDAAAVEQQDPFSITIEVDKRGNLEIARNRFTPQQLEAVVNSARNKYGQNIPVVIRGDAESKHSDIKKAMDAVTAAGIWKIKYAAIKEKMN